MSDEKPNPFNLIRYRGEPGKADFEGVTVTRQDKLFVPEWGFFVNCAPYDNHFVFEVPKSRLREGISEYMCTCGAAAVVANPETPQRLFVCLFHATEGYHSTTIINKKDFENIAGSDIELPENGKKWLI